MRPVTTAAILPRLLELRTFVQLDQVESVQFLKKSIQTIERIYGSSPTSMARLKCLFRIASFSVAIDNFAEAENAMRSAHSMLCLPPFGLFEIGDLEKLAERYVAIDTLAPVRSIIRKVASSKKKRSRKK